MVVFICFGEDYKEALKINIPPLLVIVRESNGNYIF